jgi:hypothetical protein
VTVETFGRAVDMYAILREVLHEYG